MIVQQCGSKAVHALHSSRMQAAPLETELLGGNWSAAVLRARLSHAGCMDAAGVMQGWGTPTGKCPSVAWDQRCCISQGPPRCLLLWPKDQSMKGCAPRGSLLRVPMHKAFSLCQQLS